MGVLMQKHVKINMDNNQRICLTRLLSSDERKLFSSFEAYKEEDGSIRLVPLVEVRAQDHWIYKNPKVMADLQEAFEDVKQGRVRDLGSFAQYAVEE